MAKRKSKKQQEDTSVLLESSVESRRKITSYGPPALLFIITFITGASVMGWFCVQQQKNLEQLSESFTAMQNRISHVQQVIAMADSQMDTGLVMEERIIALEEAQKQAQTEQKAQVARATSEKLKNTELHSQLLTLHTEMDTRSAEIKQVALSIATLQAMMKDQSEEFEAMKESIVSGLHSSSALSANVDGLTTAVDDAHSKADKQVASMNVLNAELQAQAHELNDLKGSLYLHNVAFHTNMQEMAAVKDFVEAKQAMCAQALEETLSSLQMTLDEQFFSSKSLHSSIMAQLQAFHSKLAKPSWSMKLNLNAKGPAAEEFVSATAQHATEVQKKLEEETEQKDSAEQAEEEMMKDLTEEEEEITGWSEEQEDAEEQAEEEEDLTEEEEEITAEHKEQEEVEQTEEEVKHDVTEEEEEITGEHEEQENAGDTAEEEGTADSVEDDKTLENEVSEDVERETAEEVSAEVNSDVVLEDEDEEDE